MRHRINLTITIVLLGGAALSVRADLAQFNAINAAARTARERGDTAALLANMKKLAVIAPGHPSLQIALARGLALDGDGAGAVAQLNRIADLGFSFHTSDDAAFQKLKDDPGFVAVAQRLGCSSGSIHAYKLNGRWRGQADREGSQPANSWDPPGPGEPQLFGLRKRSGWQQFGTRSATTSFCSRTAASP